MIDRWPARLAKAALRGTLAGAALVSSGGVAGAQERSGTVMRSPRMELSAAPATGGLMLRIRGEGATDVHRADIPGLRVDGVLQSDYTVRRSVRDTIHLENALVRLTLARIADDAIATQWTVRDGGPRVLELHLRSDDETAYYGTGERFNALNQRGYVLPVVTDDRYGNKGVGTHKPIPFFMSTRGFGIWLDGWTPAVFDLSGSERFETRVRVTDSTLRAVLIAGPSLAQILDGFTRLTGRPRVPPPWAFGLWKSRDVHHNRDSVLADVERLRRYGIPASVLVLDSPWETGYNDFVLNRRQFPEPEQMFARVESLGFRVCLWLTPFINSRNVIDMVGIDTVSSNWEEAGRRGVLVRDRDGKVAESEWWKGVGGLVDFTDPAAVAWWHSELARTKQWGARAFKADDGEGNFVPDAVFHDGTTARAMKNRYSMLYNEALQQYIDEQLGGDGVLITRSGYTGTQRVPFAWAGDNRADFSFADGLPSVILAGQNAAFSGIPLWGSDIAGYAGRPTKEVFIRWTQFGAFSPFMQVHMTSNLGPWDFDDEALAIFRDFTRLRTQLFPYLYEAAHEASRTGMPVMRPMALAFESDPEAARHVYQYLYGPDLLVAPIYQPGTSRSVYVPRGAWRDYWTGQRHDGPRIIEVNAPLSSMPMFVREGAILVRLPDDVETLVARHAGMNDSVQAMDDRRVLEVWPGSTGSVRTWDGIEATLTSAGGAAELRLASSTPRPVELRLVHRPLRQITINGRRVVARSEADKQTVLAIPRLREPVVVRWIEEVGQ